MNGLSTGYVTSKAFLVVAFTRHPINLLECLSRNKAKELIACYRSADVAAVAEPLLTE